VFDQELVKVCPECEGEYRLEIERCADCGVPLVHPEEVAARKARELPASPGLMLVQTAPIEWTRALAADLTRKGIRYFIERRRARSEGLLAVYVRRQDLRAAKDLAEERARREAPFEADAWAEDEAPPARPRRAEEPSYKVCPDCGGEYRRDIERCADCGTLLVFPAEIAEDEELEEDEPAPDFPEETPIVGPLHALPPSDDLVCICCRPHPFLPKISQALDEAGIAHRLEAAPYALPKDRVVCLYVLEEDGDAAAEVEAGVGSLNVENPDVFAELSACPACGTPRVAGSGVCKSCGLVLGGLGTDLVDTACHHCGAVMWGGLFRCANCGVDLRKS
jgi:hypothetical protein